MVLTRPQRYENTNNLTQIFAVMTHNLLSGLLRYKLHDYGSCYLFHLFVCCMNIIVCFKLLGHNKYQAKRDCFKKNNGLSDVINCIKNLIMLQLRLINYNI